MSSFSLPSSNDHMPFMIVWGAASPMAGEEIRLGLLEGGEAVVGVKLRGQVGEGPPDVVDPAGAEGDEQEGEEPKLAAGGVGFGEPAALQVAVVLRDPVVQGDA